MGGRRLAGGPLWRGAAQGQLADPCSDEGVPLCLSAGGGPVASVPRGQQSQGGRPLITRPPRACQMVTSRSMPQDAKREYALHQTKPWTPLVWWLQTWVMRSRAMSHTCRRGGARGGTRRAPCACCKHTQSQGLPPGCGCMDRRAPLMCARLGNTRGKPSRPPRDGAGRGYHLP